jgi:hypothetical protein
MAAKLELSFKSRYKATDVYSKDTKIFFGSWQKIEIPWSDFDEEVTVEQKHIGALDLLAHEVYSDSSLWYVIASYNKIYDPMFGISVGDVLRIPEKTRVMRAIKKA